MAFILGTAASQVIAGTAQSDFVFADYGDDTIQAGNGNDLLFGGFGDDRFTVGNGRVRVEGGAGSDTAVLVAGQWSVSLPTIGNFATAFNQTSGQRVVLRDVETLALGSQTLTFRYGTDGNNTLTGTTGGDFLKGRGGADRIAGGDGDDSISSGTGADTVTAGGGNDLIDERINVNGPQAGPRASNRFDLGTGHDTAILGFNTEFNGTATNLTERFTVAGGAGTDVLYLTSLGFAAHHFESGRFFAAPASGATEQLFVTLSGVEQVADVQNDVVFSLRNGVFVEGRRSIAATAALPNPTGTVLGEDLKGNAKANVLTGGGGLDHIFGGAGVDAAVIGGRPEPYDIGGTFDFGASTVTVDGKLGVRLSNNLDSLAQGLFVANDVERLRFQAGPGAADDITFNFKIVSGTATTGARTAGNDFAVFDGGLSPTAQIDMLGGNDIVFGDGQIVSIAGGLGDDKIEWEVGGAATTLTGGIGNDDVSVRFFGSGSRPQVTVDLGAGNDSGSSSGVLMDVHFLAGDGDDNIAIASDGTVDAGAGNDRIDLNGFVSFAISADTTVNAGAGADLVNIPDSIFNVRFTKAGAGALKLLSVSNGATALVRGAEGFAFEELAVSAAAFAAGKILTGDGDPDNFTGGAAGDFLSGENGDDTLAGGAGNDILAGAVGNDQATGGAGNDALGGGAGDDVLRGQDGNDIFDGGPGNDTMTGGAGFDQFRFDHRIRSFGSDTITGFQAGAGDGDVLVFRRSDLAYDTVGELLAAAKQAGANTVFTLEPNFDGDTAAKIVLAGVAKAALAADDFDLVL